VTARRVSWLALVLVLGAALLVGATGDGGPPTVEDRVDRVASRLRCPTCQGLSAADSDAPAARALREEIERRVREGQTDTEIIDYVVGRYGADIRIDPPKEGFGLVVWVLPAVAVAAAVTGLALAFRRWRPGRAASRLSDEDRALVEEALRRP
jgi:cytochrome c-type biogenesis protein CcmH